MGRVSKEQEAVIDISAIKYWSEIWRTRGKPKLFIGTHKNICKRNAQRETHTHTFLAVKLIIEDEIRAHYSEFEWRPKVFCCDTEHLGSRGEQGGHTNVISLIERNIRKKAFYVKTRHESSFISPISI